MNDIFSLDQDVGVTLVRTPAHPISGLLSPKGMYIVGHYRDGQKIGEFTFPNGITTGGKNSLLDVYFRNQTQLTAWYFGIVDNSGFTAFADSTDTMSSHSGWNEFTTYSDSTRVQWSPGAASAASITNGTPATFNINGSGTLKGIFVASNSTKGGTSGTLWSTAAFSSTVAVTNGDQLKITYTVSA